MRFHISRTKELLFDESGRLLGYIDIYVKTALGHRIDGFFQTLLFQGYLLVDRLHSGLIKPFEIFFEWGDEDAPISITAGLTAIRASPAMKKASGRCLRRGKIRSRHVPSL